MISFRKYTQVYICDQLFFDFQPLNHGNIRLITELGRQLKE
jgi:hypothetical protein